MYNCTKIVFYSSLPMSYIRVMGLQMSIYIYKLQKLMWLIIKI